MLPSEPPQAPPASVSVLEMDRLADQLSDAADVLSRMHLHYQAWQVREIRDRVRSERDAALGSG
jgi:hypothetical protein